MASNDGVEQKVDEKKEKRGSRRAEEPRPVEREEEGRGDVGITAYGRQ